MFALFCSIKSQKEILLDRQLVNARRISFYRKES